MAPSSKGMRPWSCESASYEHSGIHSTVMGLCHSGRSVVLGDRRSVALIDLTGSGSVIKSSPRASKWDVSKIASHGDSLALASNDCIDLLDSELRPMTSIHKAHERLITDLNWRSNLDPYVFSSTSLDPNVHLWDLRSIKRRPLTTLNGMIGASQCKWNRVNPNVLATVHEGDVKLWDVRRGDSPFHYFTAHVSARILSFDWSFTHEHEFVTTGQQDQLIKFHYPQRQENKNPFLKMAVPVWIARHTPFGEGLATIIIPHLHQNDNSLFLWNMNSLEAPIHSFFGHRDVIYDFDWRKCPKSGNHELVTWSRDRTLRIWQVDKTIQCQCGSEESEDAMESSASSVMNEELKEKEEDILTEEVNAIDFNHSNFTLEELNLKKRLIKLCVKESAILVISFPPAYPNRGGPPTFVFLKNMSKKSSLPSSTRQKILNDLKMVAFNLVRNSEPCLRPCLNTLESILSEESSSSLPQESGDNNNFPAAADNRSRRKEAIYFEGDGNVPYPRSSGAVFCGNGTLVVFGNKLYSRSGVTPRALSAYGAQLKDLLRMDNFENTVVNKEESATSKGRFNIKVVKSGSPGREQISGSNTLKRRKMLRSQTKVSIYNISMLFPFSKSFASQYSFNTSIQVSQSDICKMNARVARNAHRGDLIRLWMIANQMASLSGELEYWEHHPLGRPLLTSIIEHYIKAKDPQTAATLILTFQNDDDLIATSKNSRSTNNNSVKFYLDSSPKDVHTSVSSLESKDSSQGSSSTKKFWFLKPGALTLSTSPYHTVSAVTTNSSLKEESSRISNSSSFKREALSNLDLALLNPNKCRSNSWCSSAILAPYSQRMKKNASLRHILPPNSRQHLQTESTLPEEAEKKSSSSLLDPSKRLLYEKVKVTYGEVLYNWGLFNKRLEVLKRCDGNSELPDVFSPVIMDGDGREVRANMICALCQLPVKGLASSCLMCGHGGHSHHLLEWFITPETTCPSGCGCPCQKQSGESLYN